MKKIKSNNKGFSLIELIIVIAIMAVLVAIIAPNLTKYLGSSKTNTDKKNLDEVKTQVMNAISDAQTNDITVPAKANIKVKASGSSVTVTNGDGGSFDAILTTVLKGATTKSKEDPKNETIQFDISGTVANGYEVTNVKFTT